MAPSSQCFAQFQNLWKSYRRFCSKEVLKRHWGDVYSVILGNILLTVFYRYPTWSFLAPEAAFVPWCISVVCSVHWRTWDFLIVVLTLLDYQGQIGMPITVPLLYTIMPHSEWPIWESAWSLNLSCIIKVERAAFESTFIINWDPLNWFNMITIIFSTTTTTIS